jgi:hypothetical protein
VNISKNITNYLDENNWNIAFSENTMIHYTKLKDSSIYHLYILYLTNCNEYQVELGVGESQDSSQLFKLRNIVSVLKRKNI